MARKAFLFYIIQNHTGLFIPQEGKKIKKTTTTLQTKTHKERALSKMRTDFFELHMKFL